jgi:hypothetical protein
VSLDGGREFVKSREFGSKVLEKRHVVLSNGEASNGSERSVRDEVSTANRSLVEQVEQAGQGE